MAEMNEIDLEELILQNRDV